MFNSDAAVATLLSRNNARDWNELNQPLTGALLQQNLRDNQAANLALAGSALEQAGALERNKQTIDWYKYQDQEARKSRRRETAAALIAELGATGGSTAGRRLGLQPSQLAYADPNTLLQGLNSFFGGLTQLGTTSADYAPNFTAAAQYMPGLANSSRAQA